MGKLHLNLIINVEAQSFTLYRNKAEKPSAKGRANNVMIDLANKIKSAEIGFDHLEFDARTTWIMIGTQHAGIMQEAHDACMQICKLLSLKEKVSYADRLEIRVA